MGQSMAATVSLNATLNMEVPYPRTRSTDVWARLSLFLAQNTAAPGPPAYF